MEMPEWWKSLRLSAQYDIDQPVKSRPDKEFSQERIDMLDLMKEMAEELQRESSRYQEAGFGNKDPLLKVLKKFKEGL